MSNALEQVVDYLTNKIEAVNVNNPKANTGAAYLKENISIDRIPGLVYMSLQVIQSYFTQTSSETAAGEAKLTAVSSGIGGLIVEKIEEYGIQRQWELEVKVGDLFVEAYYNCGFVNLYYPQTRNSFHVIEANTNWPLYDEIPEEEIKYLIRGSVYTKPPTITDYKQMHSHEEKLLIKSREIPFDVNAPWVTAINKLQQVGWTVDKRIVDILPEFKPSKDPDPNDAKELKRKSKQTEWRIIADKAGFLSNKIFYQLIEADYRGRLYYAEPFLNFQGSDLSRGVLKFAKGKPMDSYGLYWLAVHTACSYNQSYNIDEIPDWCEKDYKTYLQKEGLESLSVDKMSLNDRVEWVNQNIKWIRKAGSDAIVYHEAEKPVSFYACCLEWDDYNNAVESDKIYRTYLPIPIDGSNNGWQHLGAMSKDSHTGKLVGLIPTEIQDDFYVQTAKELHILADGRLKEILNSMPIKHIRKGISKRGSMTRAYSAGAGKIGENMWFDCKAEDFHEKYDITEEDCMGFAKLLIKAINNVCPGPLKTMGYLQALAGVAIAQGKDTLTWTTPSQFPVEYSCFYNKSCKTRGTISGYNKYNKNCIVKHVAQVYTEYPDMRGFMCGISPNYIHSMDASHMALVIEKWTGEFAAVHDSFSTHAPDIELLLGHTKREFIDMYDVDNYYEMIESQLVEDMADVTVDRPDLGDLNIEEIEDSDYFFA